MGIECELRQISLSEGEEIDANPDNAYELILGMKVDGDFKKNMIRQFSEARRAFESLKEKYADVLEQVRQANLAGKRPPKEVSAKFEKYVAEMRRVGRQAVGATKAKAGRKKAKLLKIDKSWHGIHFLLTGKSEGGEKPLSLALLGGKQVPDRKGVMGYGPAMKLTPKEVKEVAAALAKVSADELIGRYSAAEMEQHEIYAVGQDAEEDREYLKHFYEKVVRFYAEAAAGGDGMLVYLT